MTKDEVLARLCALTTRVGEHLNHVPHECFCGAAAEGRPGPNFRFGEGVLAFVEAAVLGALEQKWEPAHKPKVGGSGGCDHECKASPPHLTATPAGTVRVRIAVAVGGHEELPIWTAIGDDGESSDESGRRAWRVNGTGHVVFVEADVPLPRQPETVQGRCVVPGEVTS